MTEITVYLIFRSLLAINDMIDSNTNSNSRVELLAEKNGAIFFFPGKKIIIISEQ